MTSRLRMEVYGAVQGVGFRPFVHGLAQRFNLRGWVRNTSGGVDIEVDGSMEILEEFVAALRRELGLGAGADTTADGAVTLVTVECLGNCDHAPCLQIDGVDRGPVTRDSAAAIVRELRGR